MAENNKKYLDRAGVAKLWELITDTFLDATSYALDKEEVRSDYEAKIQAVQDALNGLETQDATKIAELEQLIADNKEELDQAIEDKINAVVDNAPEAFDTLKEIAEYIGSDDNRTLDIISRVNELEEYTPLTAEEIVAICNAVAMTVKVSSKDEFLNALSQASGIVALEQDIDLGADLMNVAAGQELTIDLNGHDITSTNSARALQVNGGKVVIKGDGELTSTSARAIGVFNGGSLTIEGGTITSTTDVAVDVNGAGSEVVLNDGEIDAQEFGILATSGGKIEMNGGKIVTTDNCGLGGNGSNGKGDVEIVMNGGEIEANITSAGYVACGVYMPNTGSFTMNGGKITVNGGAGVVCRGGLTTINGGEIIATGDAEKTGKVGDSRIVVPCSAIVYDKNSKYPGASTLEVIIGADAKLSGAKSDIEIMSDEENPKVTDNR